jgi:hypothetical protein
MGIIETRDNCSSVGINYSRCRTVHLKYFSLASDGDNLTPGDGNGFDK